jgi:hypothetical protein
MHKGNPIAGVAILGDGWSGECLEGATASVGDDGDGLLH